MNSIQLDEVQVGEIRKLAGDGRQCLGFVGETPIASHIFAILDQLDILLLEYPIEPHGDRPAFSAAIMNSEEGAEALTFIGLNTWDYYDKQIFAVAHELYHFFTKSGSHLCKPKDEESSLIELQANRFAEEFLLPETALKSIVLAEFTTSSLEKVQHKQLLRFIARLHTTWWLPYRSLVRRLHGIGAITSEQYADLYSVAERDLQGEYGKIGQAINWEVFPKLNQPTNTIGTSPKAIEIIIRNFEDHLIAEDQFAQTLSLFNRTPAEFGYEINVSPEDIAEFDAFFSGEDHAEA